MGSKPRKIQPIDERTGNNGGIARSTCRGHARDPDGTMATWIADGRTRVSKHPYLVESLEKPKVMEDRIRGCFK